MYNINFVPHWYKEKRLSRSRKMLVLITIGLIFIDIVLSVIVFRSMKSISAANKKIDEIMTSNRVQISNSKIALNRRMIVLSSYKELLKYVSNDMQIINVDINDREVVMEAETSEKYNYTALFKCIEEDKKFTIKHISILEDKEDKTHFRIVLNKIQ